MYPDKKGDKIKVSISYGYFCTSCISHTVKTQISSLSFTLHHPAPDLDSLLTVPSLMTMLYYIVFYAEVPRCFLHFSTRNSMIMNKYSTYDLNLGHRCRYIK